MTFRTIATLIYGFELEAGSAEETKVRAWIDRMGGRPGWMKLGIATATHGYDGNLVMMVGLKSTLHEAELGAAETLSMPTETRAEMDAKLDLISEELGIAKRPGRWLLSAERL